MGCAIGKVEPELLYSRAVDQEIAKDKSIRTREIKILSLGTEASGKSTLLKQMKIIHLGGFTESERVKFRYAIEFSIISFAKDILETCEATHLNNIYSEVYQNMKNTIDKDPKEVESSDQGEILRWIKSFFESEFGKKLLETTKKKTFSLKYFLTRIEEISEKNYVPTTEDILQVRIPTTGIAELIFEYRNIRFRMVDVGGQRSERRKWIHCFSDVNAIIFVVDISSYDRVKDDTNRTNALAESLAVFKTICNNTWLRYANIILFLNKIDIFNEKILNIPLTVCWPSFVGPHTSEKSSEFIKDQFESTFLSSANRAEIYSYFTCATDTQNINYTFDASSDILMQKNLEDTGLF